MEIVTEIKYAAAAAAFIAIHLTPAEFSTGRPCVRAAHLTDLARVTEAILHAIYGEIGAGAERFENGAEGHVRADGVGLGDNQRVDAVEAGGEVGDGGRGPVAHPGESCVVRL